MLELSGVIAPMITPLTPDCHIDEESARRLVDFIIKSDVDGIFLLGTMSEGPLLPEAETRRLVEVVIEQVGGRVPVLVGAPETSRARAVPRAKEAERMGADAVVLTQPFYLANESQEALTKYFLTVAESVTVPLVVYNTPGATQNPLTYETAERLACHENVIAIKDSSGSLRYFMELLRIRARVGNFRVFMGEEWAVAPAVLAGADGTVAGIASLGGKLLKHIYNAAKAGNIAESMELQNKLIDLFHGVYGPGVARWLVGHKEALVHLGIIKTATATVDQPVSDADRKTICETVDGLREHLL